MAFYQHFTAAQFERKCIAETKQKLLMYQHLRLWLMA